MLFILSQVKQLVYGGKDWKKLWSYKFLKSLSFPFYWCCLPAKASEPHRGDRLFMLL